MIGIVKVLNMGEQPELLFVTFLLLYNYKAAFITRLIVRCHLFYMDSKIFAELN
jgi:hypothetical protein